MAKKATINKEAKKEILRRFSRNLELAGEYIAFNAKLLCPVDTGRLRSSIESKKEGKYKIKIGSNVEYAPFVELGTKYMSPRPFLMPGLLNNKEQIKKILTRKS